jgi:hypothetical protein
VLRICQEGLYRLLPGPGSCREDLKLAGANVSGISTAVRTAS